jgi:hypothetical protein
MVGVFLLIVFGAGAGILLLFLSGRAVAAEVLTEPIATAGANPFMPPVGTDQPDVTPPPATAGTFPADTPGLYGGTRNNGACDPAAMVAFLQANPEKAAAWAGVLGIGVGSIPGYVAELTPVILRSDTYVTNHGFAGGRATTLTSVLQAGTVVMVDKFGTPRVKCFCGNPLTPAIVPAAPRFVGMTWPLFTQTRITVITSATTVINTYALVDPVTTEVFERPIGSSGSVDRPVSGGPGPPAPATAAAGSVPGGSAIPAPAPTVPTARPIPAPTAPPPTASVPQVRRVTGSHTLIQQDQPDCDYADAPRIDGSITITVAADGSLSGTMAGEGSGTRHLSCGSVGATMNWSQRYTVRFTGRVGDGRLTAEGTLDNVNATTLDGCTNDGHPTPCPFYETGPGSLAIALAGAYDRTTGKGTGSFTVAVARPTSGTWSVG